MKGINLVKYGGAIGLILVGGYTIYPQPFQKLGERAYQRLCFILLPLPQDIRRKRHMDVYHRFEDKGIRPFEVLYIQTKSNVRSLAGKDILPFLRQQPHTLGGYMTSLEQVTALDFCLDPEMENVRMDPFEKWWKEDLRPWSLESSINRVFPAYHLHSEPTTAQDGHLYLDVWSTQKF